MADHEQEGAAPEQTPNEETVAQENAETTEEQAPEGTSEETAQQAEVDDTLGGTGAGDEAQETGE